MPNQKKITKFKNHDTPNNPTYLTVKESLSEIRSDKYKSQITDIIKGVEGSKDSLPCFCFGGEFTYRRKNGIVSSSGLAILDFDYTKEMKDSFNEAKKLKDILKKDDFIYAAFMSPSWKGVKALVKIPEVKSDEEYKQYYYGLLSVYPTSDSSTADISRICYASYDPEIYINESSLTWDIKADYNPETPTHVLDVPLSMMKEATDGHKHDVLRRASVLAGGYVGGGYITEEEAVEKLSDAVRQFPNYDEKHIAHFSTIKSGVLVGMKTPIKLDKAVEKKLNLTGESLFEAEKFLVPLNYGWDILAKYYDGDVKPAILSGVSFLDRYFPSRHNEMRVVTGDKGRGKTTIVLGLASLFHVAGNINYIIASMENPVERVKEYVFKYLTGRNPQEVRRSEPSEYKQIMDYVDHHFRFIRVDTIEEALIASKYIASQNLSDKWELIMDPVNSLMAGFGYKGAVEYANGAEIAKRILDFSLSNFSVHLNSHTIISKQRTKDKLAYSSDSESSWFISKASMTATLTRLQSDNDSFLNVDNVRDREKGGCETSPENKIIVTWEQGYDLSFGMEDGKERQNYAIDFVKKKFNFKI